MQCGNSKEVRCPFYRFDNGKTMIGCEGFVDGNRIVIHYSTKDLLDKQMEVFCCGVYKRCEVYRMVMAAKYPEE